MKDAWVLETAWEVCWQLGGIYTVLRSKAPSMTAQLGDNYCLAGPYNQATATIEFEETTEDTPFHRAAAALSEKGVRVHCGRWLITGRPLVVLIDFMSAWTKIADCKYFFWKDHQIDCGDEQEVNDVILFGYLVADLVELLHGEIRARSDAEGGTLPLLAHFHEWMGGAAIPILRQRRIDAATVFTTHATLLGRYLASDDPGFYEHIASIDPYRAAGDRGIFNRFAIERAATHGADCFTTVSDITAVEAEHLLGRKADRILPNGLNIRRFAALHEFQNLHQRYKLLIHEFVMGHFFPSYTFPLDRAVYIFTAGRYEYRNKGMDLFIEALARLNHALIVAGSETTVVAFIITRAPVRGINVETLKSQMMFDDLKHTCERTSARMAERLLYSAAYGRIPTIDDLLEETAQMALKRQHHAWQRHGWPPVCTHDLVHEQHDAIMHQLRTCRLANASEDRVKVIYHPEFLTGTSPLIGLDYDQFVRGTHLGVFPSHYEPWGYTPMECAALGVPSITSDLAGFGSYIARQLPDHEDRGLMIARRHGLGFDESATDLVRRLQDFLALGRRERIELRNRVEGTSDQFDWGILTRNYHAAHSLAIQKKQEREERDCGTTRPA